MRSGKPNARRVEADRNAAASGLLEEVRTRLVAAFAPERLILFGSRARPDPHPTGDIDVLVVADHPGDLYERMVVANRALGNIPCPVDVVVVTPAEYAAWVRRPGHTVRLAARQGRDLAVS